MNESEYIIEQLLREDDDEEKSEGTGVFVKQLDSGRKVYSCRCPTCGVHHGGYRTFAEAQRHLKCREHHRKEVEKAKKSIQKVDEPKKQKDIFKNPLKKN